MLGLTVLEKSSIWLLFLFAFQMTRRQGDRGNIRNLLHGLACVSPGQTWRFILQSKHIIISDLHSTVKDIRRCRVMIMTRLNSRSINIRESLQFVGKHFWPDGGPTQCSALWDRGRWNVYQGKTLRNNQLTRVLTSQPVRQLSPSV